MKTIDPKTVRLLSSAMRSSPKPKTFCAKSKPVIESAADELVKAK
jgi:hypothetical protein